MKFLLYAAVVAAVANAAALPFAEPGKPCPRPGQGCWKARRAPEPIAMPEPEAVAEAEPGKPCPRPGQGCWKAKRAPEPIAMPEPEPEAVAEADPQKPCPRPGQGCWKNKKRTPEPVAMPEPEPEAVAEANPQKPCPRPGQGCWKNKRSAEPESVASQCTSFLCRLMSKGTNPAVARGAQAAVDRLIIHTDAGIDRETRRVSNMDRTRTDILLRAPGR